MNTATRRLLGPLRNWHLAPHPHRARQCIRLSGFALLTLLVLLTASLSRAQDVGEEADPNAALPTVKQIETQLAQIDTASELDEQTRSSYRDLYQKALNALRDADSYQRKAAEFTAALQTAPRETAAIQSQLDKARMGSNDSQSEVAKDATVAQIDQQLNKVLADTAIAQARLNDLSKRLDQVARRPAEARARLATIQGTLEQLDNGVTTAGNETLGKAQALAWMRESRRETLNAEIRMLQQELVSASVRQGLYQAQRDLTDHRLQELSTLRNRLESRRSERRTAETKDIQASSVQAEREAANKHPLVRQTLAEQAELATYLTALAKQTDALIERTTRAEAQRKQVESNFRTARQRIEVAGLSRALGQVLLDQRNALPDRSQLRRSLKEIEGRIADATLRQIHYREQQRQLQDIERHVDELIEQDPHARQAQIREQLVAALMQRVTLLQQAEEIEGDYLHQSNEFNLVTEQTLRVARQYDDFLAEHLLWVRSTSTVNQQTLAQLPAALKFSLNPNNWAPVFATFARRLTQSPQLWLGLTFVVVLAWNISTLLQAIKASAEPLRRVATDSVHHTLKAIGMTLLLASPAPLLIGLTGHQLQIAPGASPFTKAFGAGLGEVALGFYCFLAFRAMCLTGGVADRHFRWNIKTLRWIRFNFDWFMLLATPLSLATVALFDYNDLAHNASLGRLMLVATMLVFAWFFARLLHPRSGVFQRIMTDRPDGWLNRLRYLWYPFIVATPLMLALLALVGYVYTAGTLFESLVYQSLLFMGLIIVHQVIVRWLILTRRRLALQAAIERQSNRLTQTPKGAKIAGSEQLALDQPELDLDALDSQTRRLIDAILFGLALIGLRVIWSDILPAFSLFEHLTLWHYSGMVDGTEQLVPVTAADVGVVALTIALAIIAARNLPGLIEILLIQHSGISPGARYAAITLAGYVITLVASLVILATLGISWDQVHWLVAALGVGIGFGLQEIVANFIAGIIILFERPVRVGDIVTIGDTTGVVTNIRIRATTIRNYDQQELLVPNKEFITERLLNWSLSDQENRITIVVGIAYGDDTRLALKLLGEVAAHHERVLKDPAPLITFEEFGDNALTLYLRCYLDSLDYRLSVSSQLRQGIYDTFSEHGISIAFPQRDIHLDTSRPLDIRLHPQAEQASATQTTTAEATTPI